MNNWFEQFKKLPENIRQNVFSLLANQVSEEEIENAFSVSISMDIQKAEPTDVTERTIGLDTEDFVQEVTSDWESEALTDDGTDTFQRRERERFEKLSFLAKGGYGEVWRIQDRLLKRTLVGKFAKQLSPESKMLFRREAQICAQLQHNGVMPLYDLIETDAGNYNLLMREIPGETFSDSIKSLPHHQHPPSMDVETVNAALQNILLKFIQVCNTIEYAHSRGVAHLDLKPANIMSGDFGEVFVIDWGIAKPIPQIYESTHQPTVYFDSKVEALFNEKISGTPLYMDREQLNGYDLSNQCDVYALGMILLKILYRTSTPYTDVEEVVQAKMDGTFSLMPGASCPHLRYMRQSVYRFEQLERVVNRAIQLDRTQRYETVGELIEDIQSWINGSEQRARAKTYLSEIDQISSELKVLKEFLQACRMDSTGSVVQNFFEVSKYKQRIDSLQIQLRQAFQKAILFLNTDVALILRYIEIELRAMWTYVRSGDFKIGHRIASNIELYLDLLPESEQTNIQSRLEQIQQLQSLQTKNALVSREGELNQLQDHLEAGKNVMVVGEPGIGKSHFVKELSARLAFYNQLYVFLDVETCVSVDDLTVVLQGALKIESKELLGVDALTDEVSRQGLQYIVVNNCEQLSEGAERWLDELCRQLSATRVVLTSRKTHNFEGFVSLRLASFSTIQSMEMVLDSIPPKLQQRLRQQHLRLLVTIVDTLHNHPLSLVLFAHRLQKIPIENIEQHLSDRLSLLQSSETNDRSASLKQSIEWSWSLLSTDAQFVLAQLSIFSGPYTVSDCEGVLNLDSIHLANVLDELESFHMLEQGIEDDGVWIRMLPAIKEFATVKRVDVYTSNESELHQSFVSHFLGLRESGMEWLDVNKRYLNLATIFDWPEIDSVSKVKAFQMILKMNQRFGPNLRGVEYAKVLEDVVDYDLLLDVRLDLHILLTRSRNCLDSVYQNFQKIELLEVDRLTRVDLLLEYHALRLNSEIKFQTLDSNALFIRVYQIMNDFIPRLQSCPKTPNQKKINLMSQIDRTFNNLFKLQLGEHYGRRNTYLASVSLDGQRLFFNDQGINFVDLGDLRLAEQCLEKSQELNRDLEHSSGIGLHIHMHADIALMRRQFSLAEEQCNKGIEFALEKGNHYRFLGLQTLLYEIQFGQSDFKEGIGILDEMYNIQSHSPSHYITYLDCLSHSYNYEQVGTAISEIVHQKINRSIRFKRTVIRLLAKNCNESAAPHSYFEVFNRLESLLYPKDANPVEFAKQILELSCWYNGVGEYEKSAQLIQEALAVNPDEFQQNKYILQGYLEYQIWSQDPSYQPRECKNLPQRLIFSDHKYVFICWAKYFEMYESHGKVESLNRVRTMFIDLSKRFPLAGDVVKQLKKSQCGKDILSRADVSVIKHSPIENFSNILESLRWSDDLFSNIEQVNQLREKLFPLADTPDFLKIDVTSAVAPESIP